MWRQGRVMLHVTPAKYSSVRYLWVTPRWMSMSLMNSQYFSANVNSQAPIFVACDVIAFIIQVIGGLRSAISDTPSAKQSAFDIMKIGLAIQLACFGLFLIVSFRFHFIAKHFRESWPDQQWPKFLWALNIAACLVFVRFPLLLFTFKVQISQAS